MSLLRRFTAALSSALLLQLTLLASGTLCAMHGAGGMEEVTAAHAMVGMHPGADEMGAPTQHGSPVSSVGATESAPSPHSGMPRGCDASSKGEGCGLPWAPGQCATMTTCTIAAASPSAELSAQVAVHTDGPTLAEAVLFHSGPAAAPELPPPRA
jgi:hypothetical protein